MNARDIEQIPALTMVCIFRLCYVTCAEDFRSLSRSSVMSLNHFTAEIDSPPSLNFPPVPYWCPCGNASVRNMAAATVQSKKKKNPVETLISLCKHFPKNDKQKQKCCLVPVKVIT